MDLKNYCKHSSWKISVSEGELENIQGDGNFLIDANERNLLYSTYNAEDMYPHEYIIEVISIIGILF